MLGWGWWVPGCLLVALSALAVSVVPSGWCVVVALWWKDWLALLCAGRPYCKAECGVLPPVLGCRRDPRGLQLRRWLGLHSMHCLVRLLCGPDSLTSDLRSGGTG